MFGISCVLGDPKAGRGVGKLQTGTEGEASGTS